MRLIDKDVLEEAVQGSINIMESHGISMIAASVPLAIIKGAPTIDAIPVEWLVSWINRHPNDLRCAWFASLEMEWQKEQEVQK